jgi:hypothetical protein
VPEVKALAVLALTVPFGGTTPPAAPPPSAEWEVVTVMGLTMHVGPKKPGLGLGGLTATMPVRVAGGEGEAVARQGLTRDITVTVREADAAQLAALFDLPPWLKPKLVGRVGRVDLKVTGDKFDLTATGFRIPGDPVARVEAAGDTKANTVRVKARVFGGTLEYDGKLRAE